MSDRFTAIREHLEHHAGKERATFSIAGVKALLDAVDAVKLSLREPAAGREEIARILFSQRQVPFSWEDDPDDAESDAGTLRSICLDDADAVLAVFAPAPQAVPAEDIAGLATQLNSIRKAWRTLAPDRICTICEEAAAALTNLSAKFRRERECYEHSEAEASDLRRKLEEARKAPNWQPTHQHLKRRSLYRFVGKATLQTSLSLRDMDAMVVYQAEDGSYWVRPDVEFYDGRFLTLAGGDAE